MKPRLAFVLGLVTMLAALTTGCGAPDERGSAERPALVAFDSCESALEGLRGAAERHLHENGHLDSPGIAEEGDAVSAEAAGTAGTAVAGERGVPEHSTTNNHETGVEEPDVVRTDGRRVVTVVDGRLRVIDVATRRMTSTVELPGGTASGLLLDGDRALVIAAPDTITMVDIGGPARILGTLTVDGHYVDARASGGWARIVVRSAPELAEPYPQGGAEQGRAEQSGAEPAFGRSSIDDWLPGYELRTGGGTERGRLVDCDRVSHPDDYSATSLLTVLSIDLAGELGIGDPVAIAADGDTVYGTGSKLYVAHQPGGRTEIHQFDVSRPGTPRYVASGDTDGTLLNQYAMSEHDGHLRVATTLAPTGRDSMPDSESVVTVLRREEGALVPVDSLAGLGRGERIYAVRFIGPAAYVVTFRETDPLYTVDLSDPARPRAVGELKITGYSAYLHPAGDGRLIGVGQEADTQGRTLGLQVSLFDVAEPATPRRIAQHHVAGGRAQAETDAHAFLHWPADGLLVLPTESDALVLRLAGDRFTDLGTIAHATPVLRAMVIGDELWTVSSSGAVVHDTGTLAERAALPFR
ncbi:beta-propeller domain-containing protein [Qaidamihabitans albus]|uniref:beta-propeller domain-containing protein n=1 Tax=Qaidamihabitans albus TaxID=2795733 RepID=UPI0018F15192|nr:beta-propeller domain-containing protein [Qaidamihabitans albus]